MAGPARWERLRPLRPDTLRVSEVQGWRGRGCCLPTGQRAGRHRHALLPQREGCRRSPRSPPSRLPGGRSPGRGGARQGPGDAPPARGLAGCPGKEGVRRLVTVQRGGCLTCATCGLLVGLNRLQLCLRIRGYHRVFNFSLNICDVQVIFLYAASTPTFRNIVR